MKISKTNWIRKGTAYTQAETALCIWEHVIESRSVAGGKLHTSDAYDWFAQEEGVYNGRNNAINLAYLVDIAYETGHGEEHYFDGLAFDWEVVPRVITLFMERADSPTEITVKIAIEVGNQLVQEL
mgnify:CR=1 FL=1